MTGRVLVAGLRRAGVATLIEALGVVDPGLVVDRYAGPLGAQVAEVVALLVIDPSSVSGESERELLDEIRASVGVVAVVCTKVDAFWDWPTITKASRRVLDPTEALPMFAVSGAAAVAGAADESGVDELAGWIREQLDDPARLAARAESARSGFADESAVRSPGVRATTEELGATRARLLRYRDRGRTDRLGALRGGLNRVRSSAIADLDAAIREIGAQSRDAVDGLRRDAVDAYVSWLVGAVRDLGERLDAGVRDDLDRIRSVALLGVEPVPATAVPPPGRPPLAVRPPAHRRRGAEDALMVLFGASVGIGMGRLVVTPLAGVATLQWVSMPLALVVGATVSALVVRVRRVSALRGQLRTWSAEVLAESRASIEHDVMAAVTAAEPVIAGQVMRHYERRARMIVDDVARVEAEIRTHRVMSRHGTGGVDPASNMPGSS